MEDDTQPQHADVYERLYDVRSYTGVYRKRFELDIHDLTDTIVHDLSNAVRTNLNHDVEGRSRRATLSPRVGLSTAPPASTAPPSTEIVANTSPEALAPACPSPIRLEGDPNDPHTLLRAVFHYYCRFGRTGSKGANETTMDNANFSKLCRECPALVDSSFTRTDVDLIFVKVKKKGERRINYTRFLDALGMIAIQKYPDMSLEASVPMLLQVHIAKLPCVVEFTDGKQVQAVWSRRLEREHSHTSSSSAPPSPPTPSRRAPSSRTSPPKSSHGFKALPPAPSMSPRLIRRVSAPSETPVGNSIHDLRRSKSELNRPATSSKSTSSPSKEEHLSKTKVLVTPEIKSPAQSFEEEEEEEEGMYFAS